MTIRKTIIIALVLIISSRVFAESFNIRYKFRLEEEPVSVLHFTDYSENHEPITEYELDMSLNLETPQVCAAVLTNMSSPFNLKLTFRELVNENGINVGRYKVRIYKYSGDDLVHVTAANGDDKSYIDVNSSSKNTVFAGTYNSVSEVYYPIAFSFDSYIDDYQSGGTYTGTITLEVSPS